MKLISHCVWWQFSRLSMLIKISNTLSLQCFNYVLVPWDFCKTSPQRHCCTPNKQKQLWWKESWKQNLHLVLQLMRLMHCIWGFTQQRSCCVPTHSLLFIQLLAFQLNFWSILGVKKHYKTLSNLVLRQHWPSVLHIFEQRLKKPSVSRRFSSCASSSQHIKGLDEEVQAQSGYYSEDSSIKSSSWQGEQAKSLLTVSANRSPVFQNSIDSLGLDIIGSWLHLQLSDNAPGEEMKSWKFTLCNFVNHYSETGLRSHLLARCWADWAKHHVWET